MPAPHQPEIAVDVANLEAEQQLHEVMVGAADHDAVHRVGAADLPAVDPVDIVGHLRPQRRHFRRIILAVAVGIEDEVLGRRRKSGAQRAAVAAILLVVDDADVIGIDPRQLVEDPGGVVLAAVVDDHHFIVVGQRRGDLDGGDHQAGDRAGIVVGRKEHAEPGHARHVTWTRRARRSNPAMAQDQLPRRDQRLDQDAARQLRRADPALDENDRRLDDPQPGVRGHERDIEQERVAVRDNAVERQRGQRFAAPAAIAGGDVVQLQAGDGANVEVRERAEDDAAQRPVHDADAVQVARADHEVGAGGGRVDHRRQVLRIVRQVRVHLADEVGVGEDSAAKSFEVGDAQAALAGPMQRLHASRILLAERVGNLAGAVGRLIVEHHHVHAGDRHQIGDEDRQVVLLVVGRNQDQRLHRRPSKRSVAICSETRPTSSTITENISASTAPFGIRSW